MKSTKLDCVLIDDDILVHMTWKMVAREKGLSVQIVSTKDEFFSIAKELNQETPIYIDSNLAGGVKGELLAKEIYELGFRNLYLATGYPADQFGDLPWIKAVVGKEPPWA